MSDRAQAFGIGIHNLHEIEINLLIEIFEGRIQIKSEEFEEFLRKKLIDQKN